jgi:hypothetical protein
LSRAEEAAADAAHQHTLLEQRLDLLQRTLERTSAELAGSKAQLVCALRCRPPAYAGARVCGETLVAVARPPDHGLRKDRESTAAGLLS